VHPSGLTQVLDEHPSSTAVDLAALQGGEDQREAFAHRGGEAEFSIGGCRGQGDPGGDLVGGPLEPLLGPRHRPTPPARQVGGQVVDGDRVADLHYAGQQLRLVMGQLPGPGLQDLDQPRIRNPLPRQATQRGGQLRTGRQRRRPIDEFRHPGHGSKLRSTPEISGVMGAAQGKVTRKA
jgi:hypothetical protein